MDIRSLIEMLRLVCRMAGIVLTVKSVFMPSGDRGKDDKTFWTGFALYGGGVAMSGLLFLDPATPALAAGIYLLWGVVLIAIGVVGIFFSKKREIKRTLRGRKH